MRERATGRAFADDVARLWRDLGCTRDAVVAVDGAGVALAGGGLAATARDWARVALLAVDGAHGAASGCSTRPGSRRPPGRRTRSWRRPAAQQHHHARRLRLPLVAAGRRAVDRVTADGSRGQFACVDRRTGAVVVKTSQWPYDDFLVDRQARDLSYLGLARPAGRRRHPSTTTKEHAP